MCMYVLVYSTSETAVHTKSSAKKSGSEELDASLSAANGKACFRLHKEAINASVCC